MTGLEPNDAAALAIRQARGFGSNLREHAPLKFGRIHEGQTFYSQDANDQMLYVTSPLTPLPPAQAAQGAPPPAAGSQRPRWNQRAGDTEMRGVA